ncbi:hypothetical protein G7054_g10050 [Neopestalotiopsis clavispora]|nr:hypothetical protein G7054_g10050 [Neopestalotiopsis clavispora]
MATTTTRSAQDVISALNLSPHPEKGYFIEMSRDGDHGTAIYYLLEKDAGRSHWHKVTNATEIWHHYGGAQQIGAFDEVPPRTPRTPRTPAHNITVHFDRKSFEEDDRSNAAELPLKLNVVKIGKPPSPKAHTPVLKLKTSFDTTSAASSTHKSAVIRPLALKAHKEVTELAIRIDALDDNEQPQQHNEGDVTARPMAPGMSSFWNGIDELLAPKHDSVAMSPVIQRLRASQQSRLGPATPNGYDDISPITRGEWGFLTTGKGWTGGRTAAVETC